MQITGKRYLTLAQTCVYEWIRDSKHLYIGVSKNGIARPIVHDVINKAEAVLPSDVIRLTPFPDCETALKYERFLIETKNPKYNIAHNTQKLYEPKLLAHKVCSRCQQTFKPVRPWQKSCKRQKCKILCQTAASDAP